MTNDIKIASLNVRGIQNPKKIQELTSYFEENGFDIIGLQEVAFRKNEYLGEVYQCFPNTGQNKQGTGLLVKKSLKSVM